MLKTFKSEKLYQQALAFMPGGVNSPVLKEQMVLIFMT
jgi:glutamate-1-semialdehyde aminotransferase